MIRVAIEPTFEAFREAARPLCEAGVAPDAIAWEEARPGTQTGLFGAPPASLSRAAPVPGTRDAGTSLRVPRAFVASAELAILHRDGDPLPLLYRVLHRLTHGEASLLGVEADPDVVRLHQLVQNVRREEHKMHAFVRFRPVRVEHAERFVAWYAPRHRVLHLAAPFFARRFASMEWSILTPDGSMHWDGEALTEGPPAPRDAAPNDDELDELFRGYWRSIFNPARMNLDAMRSEMPLHHWSTLPETRALASMVAAAAARTSAMIARPVSAASAFVPEVVEDLDALARAARGCSACTLHSSATQTVFGHGRHDAKLMLVGEQPGDEEDRKGEPFVGPAGGVLERALHAAGLARSDLYLTNAVKHFKWTPRGKRRLHQRPVHAEVLACRAWLDAEIAEVRPRIIVCLGSTAATAFVGKNFRVTQGRGRLFQTPHAEALLATYHPSAILRAPDPTVAERMFRELVEDLRCAADAAGLPDARPAPRGTDE